MEKIKELFKNTKVSFTSEDDLSESEIEVLTQYIKGKQIPIDSSSPPCLNIMGLYHLWVDIDYIKMEKFFLRAIQNGNVKSMNNYAHYHENISKDYVKMQKYYLMAIKNGSVDSMNNYAYYRHHTSKDYQQMQKYYLMAIQNGFVMSMHNYAHYHQYISKDYRQMEKYYLMAIQNGHVDSMNNYAHYHQYTSKDYQQMQKYYLMAIQNGFVMSMHNYGHYHQYISKDYRQMEKYYLMVLDTLDSPEKIKGFSRVIDNLSKYYDQPPSLQGLKFFSKYNPSKFNEQLSSMSDLSDECWEFLSNIDKNLIESSILRNMAIRLQKKVDLLDVHFKYTDGMTIQEIKKDFFSKNNTSLDQSDLVDDS